MIRLILILYLSFFRTNFQDNLFLVKIDGETVKKDLVYLQKKADEFGCKISFPYIKYDDSEKITIVQIVFLTDVGKHVITLDFSKDRSQCVQLIRDFRKNAEVVSGILTC
jgi:hypothetical protein